MVPPSRRSGASLIEALWSDPERFDFAPAVRLLERAAETGEGGRDPGRARVGLDNDPAAEAVRLRAALELVFPEAEIADLEDAEGRAELAVNLMGLNGPSGVLPGFYSQLVLDAERDKNRAMRNFLDLFNHRALSFFVRATEKYSLPLAWQQSGGRGTDAVSAALLALVGLRQDAMRRRQAVADETLVFYGGHYAHRPRSAGPLAQLLSEYFEGPATISQFQGRWARLPPQEQSRLGPAGQGAFQQLGVDSVAGSKVYDVQGAFRVGLGPLDYQQFLGFLPDGERMRALQDLTRAYVGPALSFDVQLTLKAEEIPPLALTAETRPRLGWNTWLPTGAPREDAADAIFEAPEE